MPDALEEHCEIDGKVFVFGSESGSTFAFYFFLLIALVIGYGAYALLTKAGLRRKPFAHWPALPRPLAALVGFFLFLMVFSLVYLRMIYGFYRLEVNADTLHLTYILPRHVVRVPFSNLGEVSRKEGSRSWRLLIYSRHGAKYASTQAGYAEVKEAWEQLRDLPGASAAPTVVYLAGSTGGGGCRLSGCQWRVFSPDPSGAVWLGAPGF